jgi:hypothetical protein
MWTDRSRVIVRAGVCECCVARAHQVHHRDFPEIRAEGGSIAEGAARLADHLSRYREGAQGTFHRDRIDWALADVAALLDTLAPVGSGHDRATSCRCGDRGPAVA